MSLCFSINKFSLNATDEGIEKMDKRCWSIIFVEYMSIKMISILPSCIYLVLVTCTNVFFMIFLHVLVKSDSIHQWCKRVIWISDQGIFLSDRNSGDFSARAKNSIYHVKVALCYYHQQLNMEEHCDSFDHPNPITKLHLIINTFAKMDEIKKGLEFC